MAVATKVIGHETAILKCAFDDPTSGKGTSSKIAVSEFDANKRSGIKQHPIQIATIKCAIDEAGGHVQAFTIDAMEFAAVECLVAP